MHALIINACIELQIFNSIQIECEKDKKYVTGAKK